MYLLLFLVGFLTDVCKCCETGYYSSNGECQKCPKNCASCSSASSCTSCNAGYYGETCYVACPDYCHMDMCNQISGQCLSCKEGYFHDENYSCSKCPENCTTCNSKQFCFTCKSGYKGEYCQSVCSKCKSETSCDKHSGYCHSDCEDGLSGELCDTPCNLKCESCDRYKPNECISCAPDRRGHSCNETCPRTCALNSCDVRNGNCTSGCVDGFWGERCEKICLRQCNNQVCYQSNGECMFGCIDEFSGIECSTRQNSLSLVLIAGVIVASVILIVCVFVVFVYITRKRRSHGCTSSLGESTHHLLCTSDKTSKEPEAKPMKPLNKRQKILNKDMEKWSAQPPEKADVIEVILKRNNIEPEKENQEYIFRASHVTKSNESIHIHDTNANGSNTVLSVQLKASSDKQETVPMIHFTAEVEEKNKINASKEVLNMKRPFKTHSNEKENKITAVNKPFADTPIQKENDGTNIDKTSEKQKEEPVIYRNTQKNKNASRFNDGNITKTSLQGKSGTVSKRPTPSSLKKDENDESNYFVGIRNTYNNRVENFDDNKEDLSVNVGKSEIMKINENAMYRPIEVNCLAQYVAKKDQSDYRKEFQESFEAVSSINESKMLSMGTSQTNIQRTGLPVILEGEVSSNIDAYFIIDGPNMPNAKKAYISYIGPMVTLSSCKRAFWKTVWQERCGTIVMLTPEYLLPEEKCICVFGRVSCSEMYGDIQVSCKGEEHFDSFSVRKYTITKQTTERDVKRLLFTKWPSYGLPDEKDVSSFVDFIMEANTFNNHRDGPTMVHCSSVRDRTGIYIALDILTKQGNDTGYVDIFGCVRQLREQRVNMINDCEQYTFLHKALVISLSKTSNNRHEEAHLST